MESILTTEEFDLSFAIREVFADGSDKAREIVGTPVWSASPEGVVEIASDGAAATIRGLAAGSVTVTVAGRATAADGERDFSASLEVQVTEPAIETGTLTVDFTAGEHRPRAA